MYDVESQLRFIESRPFHYAAFHGINCQIILGYLVIFHLSITFNVMSLWISECFSSSKCYACCCEYCCNIAMKIVLAMKDNILSFICSSFNNTSTSNFMKFVKSSIVLFAFVSDIRKSRLVMNFSSKFIFHYFNRKFLSIINLYNFSY